MEPQFEELARQISDVVTERVSDVVIERVSDIVTKRVSDDVMRQIAAAERRISDNVTAQIGAAEDRIAERVLRTVTANVETIVETAKDELKHQATVNVEEVKQQATAIAESYGGVLDGIHRQLQDLNAKVDVKFRDHDLVLANHHGRITKLEKH